MSGPAKHGGGPHLPDPRMIPVSRPPSWFEPAVPARPTRTADLEHTDVPPAPKPGTREADGAFVRPFVVTGGRTRPLTADLRIETLVQAEPGTLSAPLRFEQHQIVEVAQRPVSVAEVAARLDVPLGVARVLIADLFEARYVSLHAPTDLPVHVIERIRDLVRAL
jgi:Protein of unknown function (DUF742)